MYDDATIVCYKIEKQVLFVHFLKQSNVNLYVNSANEIWDTDER